MLAYFFIPDFLKSNDERGGPFLPPEDKKIIAPLLGGELRKLFVKHPAKMFQASKDNRYWTVVVDTGEVVWPGQTIDMFDPRQHGLEKIKEVNRWTK